MSRNYREGTYNWLTEEMEVGPWQELSRWHPARLLGYDLYRVVTVDGCGHFDRWRNYARSQRLARQLLERIYGERS